MPAPLSHFAMSLGHDQILEVLKNASHDSLVQSGNVWYALAREEMECARYVYL
jgi:hypothetical protein